MAPFLSSYADIYVYKILFGSVEKSEKKSRMIFILLTTAMVSYGGSNFSVYDYYNAFSMKPPCELERVYSTHGHGYKTTKLTPFIANHTIAGEGDYDPSRSTGR